MFALVTWSAPAPAETNKPILSKDLAGAITWDTSAVIDASALVMRGIDNSSQLWPVRFSDAALKTLREPHFRFEGFSLSAAGGRRLPAASVAPAMRGFDAVLKFTDILGRRTAVALRAEYDLSNGGLQVGRADVMSIVPERPTVRFLFVPAADLPSSSVTSHPKDTDFLRLAMSKAVAGPGRPVAPTGPTDFYVFAFFLNRLPPDANVEMRVSAKPDGIGGTLGNSVELSFHGWKTAVLRATFALDDTNPLYFKAIYRISGDISGTPVDSRMAGVHANRVMRTTTLDGKSLGRRIQ